MDEIPQFKWRFGYGDVVAHRYDTVVKHYWDKVAVPALDLAETEVAYWATNEEGGSPFIHADMVNQLSVTASAMCLSVQSIWERQLRAYLLACIHWADEGLRTRIHKAHWDALQGLFLELRGVPVQALLSYPDLDLLAQLGNVCRHGAGRAANALWRKHPELWPEIAWPIDSIVAPPIEQLHLSRNLLARLVDAIASFWQMIVYLYNESLTIKPESLVRTLKVERVRLGAAIVHFNTVVRTADTLPSKP
jgi:hypothetical protein